MKERKHDNLQRKTTHKGLHRIGVHSDGRVAQLRLPPPLFPLNVGVDVTVPRLRLVSNPHLLIRLILAYSVQTEHEWVFPHGGVHSENDDSQPTPPSLPILSHSTPDERNQQENEDQQEKEKKEPRTGFQRFARVALIPRGTVADDKDFVAHAVMLTRRIALGYGLEKCNAATGSIRRQDCVHRGGEKKIEQSLRL